MLPPADFPPSVPSPRTVYLPSLAVLDVTSKGIKLIRSGSLNPWISPWLLGLTSASTPSPLAFKFSSAIRSLRHVSCTSFFSVLAIYTPASVPDIFRQLPDLLQLGFTSDVVHSFNGSRRPHHRLPLVGSRRLCQASHPGRLRKWLPRGRSLLQ